MTALTAEIVRELLKETLRRPDDYYATPPGFWLRQAALYCHHEESDAAFRERASRRLYDEQEPGVGGPHSPVAVATRETAERAAREAKREQLLVAKKRRLGEMLRAPFAPRFQAEEPAWRKR
jgi:hypothetical protein